jgi:quinol monooxygenase YgiN
MYARSTTVHGDPQQLDDGIDYVRREVMPAVGQMAGCIGLSLLVDRQTGRCIITTAWRDEASMHDTEGAVHDMRKRAAELLGGRAQVQEWEIALVHRLHETHNGACTRVIWADIDPAKMQDQVDTLRMSIMPRIEDLPGFCAVTLMVDRDNGRSAMSVTYASREDMRLAGEQALAVRADLVRATGMQITDIVEFDLVVAHLRVPETA